MDEFSVSYDRTTKVVTAVACALLALPAAAVHNLAVRIVAILTVLVSFAYSVRSYNFADGSIVVKRFIGNVRVPLQELQEARAATADDFRGCVRLWGSGGMFGYYGWFRTSRLGRCKWYLTDRSQAVVVRTETQTVLFSPDERDRFLERVRGYAPTVAIVPQEPLLSTLQSYSSADWPGRVAALAVGALALVLVGGVLLYAPGPPSYSLTPQALTIHDSFFPVTVPASAVDVSHIRVIDFAQDPAWRPTSRTNGIGTLHYHAGWFRVANGEKVRLYRGDSQRLVLLPPKGAAAPVLCEVKDPEQFVQSIKREWAGVTRSGG